MAIFKSGSAVHHKLLVHFRSLISLRCKFIYIPAPNPVAHPVKQIGFVTLGPLHAVHRSGIIVAWWSGSGMIQVCIKCPQNESGLSDGHSVGGIKSIRTLMQYAWVIIYWILCCVLYSVWTWYSAVVCKEYIWCVQKVLTLVERGLSDV